MLLRLLVYIWAFPATLIGLCLIPFALLPGGGIEIVDGVLEAHSPLFKRLFAGRIPLLGNGAALTFGHVILARDADCLRRSRAHERVHVRQFERWGIFLLPLYVAAGIWARRRGGDVYLDNPFEREAFRAE